MASRLGDALAIIRSEQYATLGEAAVHAHVLRTLHEEHVRLEREGFLGPGAAQESAQALITCEQQLRAAIVHTIAAAEAEVDRRAGKPPHPDHPKKAVQTSARGKTHADPGSPRPRHGHARRVADRKRG